MTLDDAIDLMPDAGQLYKERAKAKLSAGNDDEAKADMQKYDELNNSETAQQQPQPSCKAAEFDNIVGIFK